MRTFDLSLALDMRAVVPEQWLDTMRESAQAEDATAFLKEVQAKYPLPEQDDDFLLMILKNGLRRGVRQHVKSMFEESGIGGTLAPATMVVRDREFPKNVEPVLASEVCMEQLG